MTNTTAPAFTHTPSCTDQYLGRAFRIETANGAATADAEWVRSLALKLQDHVCIDCAKTALHSVEAKLPTLRKRERALRNSPAFGSAEYSAVANEIDTLVWRRDAIRAELAR